MPHMLALAFNTDFADLYTQDGLAKLDAEFINWLTQQQETIAKQLLTARALPEQVESKDESTLMIELAPWLEQFIGILFNIEPELGALTAQHHALAPLYTVKRLFVQRQAVKAHKTAEAEGFDEATITAAIESHLGEPLTELTFATKVTQWELKKDAHATELAAALQYAAWALQTPAGQHKHAEGILFKKPQKLDFENLVPTESTPITTANIDGVTMLQLPKHHVRHREGFALTDNGGSLEQALDQANYCIFCHNQGKDSCSKGLKDKEGNYKVSPTKVTQTGCPVEEHISEMHALKAQGVPLGALAAITVNNPMAAGTGHRICNDCMKGCIYQKQEPVNIPLAETRTLDDILNLPWGFEIYSLLTRWNPLNIHRPLPKPESGYKVLVAGLGPAGYTLAHHLMNDGHGVIAVDGLKIEPLDESISGVNPNGTRASFQPIYKVTDLYQDLGKRPAQGFGGVAEYGITVRWNKNYLTLIRLLLERRAQFAMFGGVRFGSTLTVDDAFKMGFDHIALCMGAGKPTVLTMPGGVTNGVRTASDFLMSLQLTGAGREDSIANLHLRLPVVVIGGGLTAIDTATESLAYYPLQVEKFLTRFELLSAAKGEDAVRQGWSDYERETAEEWLTHARAFRAERATAKAEKRDPDFLTLMNAWGGVMLAYRRRLQDAPSYRLNHEEVELAMQEGIRFAENLSPERVEVDHHGHAQTLICQHTERGEIALHARTVLVAAGTQPNTVIEREDPAHFLLDGKYFQTIDDDGNPSKPEWLAKPQEPQMLLYKGQQSESISFFGDLHPSFAGNVVKAMGSAKQGYPTISRILTQRKANGIAWDAFAQQWRDRLIAVVQKIERLAPNIIEVIVKAPLAAEHFEPGQFYRLQNFERYATKTNNTTLAMEGLALTGAWTDKEQGLLSTIVLEMGGSSDLCDHLQVGEPVVLMGPTGTPTDIPENETVLLAGGGLGNAVLFSIGKAMREQGNKVLYVAGYRTHDSRFKLDDIEAAADTVIWCCDEPTDWQARREQDKVFHGNIVQALLAYQTGELGDTTTQLTDVDRIIAIGSDRMMAGVTAARHDALKNYLKPNHIAIGSINSPMQCMMKEICAQCLQKHIDPKTGEETYVYSCFNQDQALDHVSFPHLRERLTQNSLQEKLTSQWIKHCLHEQKEKNAA